jgi:hypothetical protein
MRRAGLALMCGRAWSRAIEDGDTALVVVTHRPVPFEGIPVREIRMVSKQI